MTKPNEQQFNTLAMIAMGVLPLGSALGLHLMARPVAWVPVLIITTTILAGAIATARDAQSTGRRRILVGSLAIVAGVFGSTYVIEPWLPTYDNYGLLGLELGFVIAGFVVGNCAYVMVVARPSSPGRVALMLLTGVMGGFLGFFVGIPMYAIWVEDLFRKAPSGLSREAFALIGSGGVAALFAAVNAVCVRDQR